MAKRNWKFYPDEYATGEYAVGTKCFTVVDSGRKEVLGAADGDRKIAVRMYYPVDRADVVDRERAVLFSEKKKAALQKAYHIKGVSDEMDYADYYEDVEIVTGKKFPLIMFSMGYNAYIECNTYLLCELASRGYIIASVGHANEAVENDYEDGSCDFFDKKINKMMYTSMLGALINQGRLLKAKVNEEEAVARFDEFQNKYTPYIKGRVPEWAADVERALAEVRIRYAENLDLSRGVGASGHSLGGCTAYYLCRYSDEFTCGINIDGGLFGDYPDKAMEAAFCQISCRENVNVETRPLLDSGADTYQVIFEDMKHIGFTDAKFYIPIASIAGKLDNNEMFRHLVYSHRAFFDKYLKGDSLEFVGMESGKVSYRKVL